MVPWKKDAGKKKAGCNGVEAKRQDDGEKELGMFWVEHQSEPVVVTGSHIYFSGPAVEAVNWEKGKKCLPAFPCGEADKTHVLWELELSCLLPRVILAFIDLKHYFVAGGWQDINCYSIKQLQEI